MDSRKVGALGPHMCGDRAHTTITNLTPLTTIGVQVSVTVTKHSQGPWSPAACG